MVPTVFDKTQARGRKSIFRLKSYKNVAVNHLELIRDKLKKFLEMKIQVLNGIPFKNGIDSTCRLETTAFAKWVVKTHLGTIERIRVKMTVQFQRIYQKQNEKIFKQ